MRSTFVVLVALGWVAACGAESSSGAGAMTAPANWSCTPTAYGDGAACHCACGAIDPDCANPDLLVSDCLLGQVCPAGSCTWCGNGAVDDGEQCDPALEEVAQCGPLGYQPGEVACNATCAWAYDRCLPLATCGNGVLDADELCDGHQLRDGLGCADHGLEEGMLACTARCGIDPRGCSTCGNGGVEGAETCDDGQRAEGDGCSAACAIDRGWQCSGAPSTCAPRCGDGILVGGETCDDGDTDAGDGCSSVCQIEVACGCTGQPSRCSCVRIETVATYPVLAGGTVEAASLVRGDDGGVHVVYAFAVDVTAPEGHNAQRVHLMHGERTGATWTTSEIHTWDETHHRIPPEHLRLSSDGGALRVYFERVRHPMGNVAVATRTGSAWQLATDLAGSTVDAARGGGAWHVLSWREPSGPLYYRSGGPGAWTIDERVGLPEPPTRIAYDTRGDVYVGSLTALRANTFYTLALRRRAAPTGWATVYEHTTSAPAGGRVVSIWDRPIALHDGAVAILDEGFDCTGARWLRAHRMPGASGPELVADLSAIDTTCYRDGSSHDNLPKTTTVDSRGRLHVVYSPPTAAGGAAIEDHYRDATGWRTRTIPIDAAVPLAVHVDEDDVTHLLALVAGGSQGRLRVAYLQIGPSGWIH